MGNSLVWARYRQNAEPTDGLTFQKFKDYVGGNVLLPFEREYGKHLLSAGKSDSVIVPLARHGSPSDSVIVLLTPTSGHPRENGNERWLRRREEMKSANFAGACRFVLRWIKPTKGWFCFLHLSFNILSICWLNREDQTIWLRPICEKLPPRK